MFRYFVGGRSFTLDPFHFAYSELTWHVSVCFPVNLTLSAQEALCCLGDFSLAAQKPQPLSLELIISTSAQGTATTICTHYQQ